MVAPFSLVVLFSLNYWGFPPLVHYKNLASLVSRLSNHKRLYYILWGDDAIVDERVHICYTVIRSVLYFEEFCLLPGCLKVFILI